MAAISAGRLPKRDDMTLNSQKLIKILIIGTRWPPETFLQRLFRGLAEAGMEVTIASSQKPDGAWLSHPNIRWLHAPLWDGSFLNRLFCLAKMFFPALMRRPRDTLRLCWRFHQTDTMKVRLYHLIKLLPFVGRRWDIVYFPWNLGVPAYFSLFNSGGAALVSCRGSQINIPPHGPGGQAILGELRDTFAKATAVHCVSEAIKNESLQSGLDPAKAWVIRPAVDPDFFSPAVEPKTGNSTFRIITVGSLSWIKGYEYALLAVRRLVDQGVSVQFHIIGDGAKRYRLLYTIDDLDLHGQVHLHGKLSQSEVRSRLQQADVFLLASLSEGISNAVLEAMACGLPVVTTDCGGMREAVTDGVEGLVVPVRDSEGMAAALSRLASDRILGRRMGQAARERVLSEFTIKQQVDKFIELYQSILAN
jgi:colanic acid/amylovoran biosynthesis glycosyltransferase